MGVKGYLLEGIYANKLDRYQVNNDLILYSVEPLLYIRKENESEITYWKMDWIEDNVGEDFLIIKEQEIPEPLEYELIDNPYHKHVIMSPSFSIQDNLIKKVSGYGFKDSDSEILSSIILELDKSFVIIKKGPVIEIRITDEETIGDIIFST